MNQPYKNYIRLNHWLGLRRLGAEKARVRIIFFPFIGGQSLSFELLSKALPDHWELWAVDPPGHGWTRGEPLSNFNEMIDLYFRELDFLWEGEFHLFGHSLGGLVVYGLTQLMEEKDINPGIIFLGAPPLPHRITEYEYLREEDPLQLIQALNEFGDIPTPHLEGNRHLLNHYIEPIKADIKAFLGSQILRISSIKASVVVLYSKNDAVVPYKDIFEWDIYADEVKFEAVEGGHLFIKSHYQDVAAKIVNMISNG